MRNLKKILALVLALMMVLSVMVFASAANYDDYSDKDQVSPEYAEAVEVLTGMDIFWGSENSFYPKSNVTRAEVATLLYRIMTGDITGSQVGIYKDYGMFDDVLETNWFAGYVNYAANGELVVGVGDDKYNPQGNVTGYEWITMLLRAIGYDANGEISGSTWKITAASLAKQAGILGSFNEATLNSALTREQVAYLLFNAIQARKVNYTNAFGYRPSSLGYTIAWDMFRLAKTGTISIDAWGRPGYVWYGESSSTATPNTANYNSTVDTLYATMEEAPVKTYNTAVTECDVASAVDIKTSKTYDAWYNGNQVIDGETIVATATTVKIGGQGMLTEVYKDRIVYIDTYLASVDSVAAATFDAAGHLKTSSRLVLDVYTVDGGAPETITLYNGETNYTYTAGQYLLVNAVDNALGNIALKVGTYGWTAATLDILQVANSMVGAQSKLWWNAEKHTIGGTDYNDAVQFNLDQALQDQVTNHTWFFDQYGNLIGAVDVISTNYAVLKNIQWVPVTGSTGYAQATLVDLAGNESTVKVNSIDGDAAGAAGWRNTGFVQWDANNFGLSYTDNNSATLNPSSSLVGFSNANTAYVSNELSNNSALFGYAMYRVDTNLDGTVNLQGAENGTIVSYAAGVTVTTNASAITDGGVKVISVDNSTQFLVRGVNNTYKAYAGTANVPSFTTDASNVFYVDVDNDTIAEYVYIKSGTPVSLGLTHVLYVTSPTYSYVPNSGVYMMENVILDGTPNSTVYVRSLNDVTTLVQGVGKTYVVEFTSGVIDTGDVALSTMNSTAVDAPAATSHVVYLGDDVTVGNGVLVSEYAGRTSYYVNNAVVLGQYSNLSELSTAALDGYGVWVVYTPGVYNTVSHVYVGTALNESANMFATVKEGTATVGTNLFDVDDETWTYTGDAGDQVTLSVSVAAGATLTGNVTENVTLLSADTHNKPFTVVSEAGNVTHDYTVKLTGNAAVVTVNLAAGEYTLYVGSAIQDQPTLAYENKADALDNLIKINPANNGTENVVMTLGTAATSAGQTSNLDVYESLAIADASNFNGSTSENVDLTSGNVILVQITYNTAETCYVAYIVE